MDKQHIIDEIRRTAAANAGTPLGRERFAHETGIRISDWSGRYWARWGDALREAGFEPNQFQAAYDADHLLQCLVDFIRELRRFPVHGELRLRASQDPTFPSHTIWRRFGGKAHLAASAREFCSGRLGYADVAAICETAATEVEKRSTRPASVREPSFGFVYLFRSGRNYKIGRSNAVGRREYELAIQLPDRVEKVHEIKTDDPVGIEAYWHRRFASKRKNGEWFALAAEDIAAFKRRRFM